MEGKLNNCAILNFILILLILEGKLTNKFWQWTALGSTPVIRTAFLRIIITASTLYFSNSTVTLFYCTKMQGPIEYSICKYWVDCNIGSCGAMGSLLLCYTVKHRFNYLLLSDPKYKQPPIFRQFPNWRKISGTFCFFTLYLGLQ